MKTIKTVVAVCCIGFVAFTGDTNFVAAFNAVYLTHSASNILVFTEHNVSTNASPETLFARGSMAIMLQEWGTGATNYWEQAIQMITTNDMYSAIGKTNVIREIRLLQNIVAEMTCSPQPTWNTNNHTLIFAEMGAEAPFFDTLKNISVIERVEN